MAETEIACEWIDGAPADTRWHVIDLAMAGDDPRTTVYAARIALRNALDAMRRERRSWRGVEVRAWVVDLTPLSRRVYGRVVGLLAATSGDVDGPAIRDMLAWCRSWRDPDATEVDGPLMAGEARDAVAGIVDEWCETGHPNAGSRRIVIGPQNSRTRTRSSGVRIVVRQHQEPMPWLM
jgi:hypothetical protein